VTDLDILPVQEYIGDRLKIRITGGKAAASGTIGFSKERQGNFDISYKGDAGVGGFSSVDRAGETFLTWESLQFKDMNIRDSFRDILIKGITLSQFYSQIVVQPDGVLNVLDIVERKTAGKKTERSAEGPAGGQKTERKIVVESTTLEGGTIHFTDDHIKPRYEAFLARISGRMARLSTSEKKPADVDLLAKFNAYAPLEITGKVNPFGALLVDLRVDFKDMDMTPLNPYATRYIGYTIEKGKVAFNLKYEIVKTKLNAQNNIVFDQLTLGQKVESPQAVKLPIKFAISLLKNRKGEINLDVPVSGDLSSPKFSIGDVVLKAIGKLITRIVTSPFSLIASLFGGGSGEHLAYLEFNPGESVIGAQEAKKLDTLIKGLHERPHLKLDIAGYADPKRDREALRQERFQRKLKEQKLKGMNKQGKPPLPVNQITIGPEEKDKYLWEVYRKEKFPKPTNILGMVKKLPAEEMEKLILTHIDITDQDLRHLANERATAARDYILKSGKVDPERLFLVEEEKVVPPEKEGVSESRVEFTLE
jgi:hypothetical protein